MTTLDRLEKSILKSLITNEDYSRRALPFLKEEYFHEAGEAIIFQQIRSLILAYNSLPTYEALTISIGRLEKVSADAVKDAEALVAELKASDEKPDTQWLIDNTEKFCQEKAVFNAVSESIGILDPSYSGKKTKAVIPEILSQALAVSFDRNVGHDFLDDAGARFDFYHKVEARIPFDLKVLNRITKGGVSKKTLMVILAPTGIGKSLVMCHMAAANLAMGKNVLYITAEMAEEKIAERIDANLLNVSLDDLPNIPKDMYNKRMDRLKKMTGGKLIIKEYPTATASAAHFKTLLNELMLKKNFRPDIIYIDYINICISSRYKLGNSVNTYSYVKAIAEEFRGLAVEYDVPVITATQVNRQGFNSTDVDLTNTSESIGLPATADFMIALISTEDLEKKGMIMMKKLKHRDSDPLKDRTFLVGIDRSKMRLFDVEDSVQDTLVKPEQVEETKSKFNGIQV